MAGEGRNSVEARLARVEEGYVSLRSEVHDLANTVREQGKQVSESLSMIHEKIAHRTETNWGNTWSALGVLLAFVVSIGAGALSPLYIMAKSNANQIERTNQQLGQRLDAKIDAMAQVREQELDNLDEVLQREMRLLNSSQDMDAEHISSQMSLLREQVNRVDMELRKHEMLDGHPTALAISAELARRADGSAARLQEQHTALDSKLQQEMALANQTLEARLEAVEKTFAREVEHLHRYMDREYENRPSDE